MTNYSSVTKNALLATAQILVSAVVLFLIYRYLLDLLGSERVGIWSIVLATASVSRVTELGLAGGAVKFVAEAHAAGDYQRVAEVIQTAFLTVVMIMTLVVVVLSPAAGVILSLIVPDANLEETLAILPYALASVWLSSTGGVLHASLDGCQRADLRALISIMCSCTYAAFVFFLTPRWGLAGVGMAHVFQGMLIVVASWVVLRQEIDSLPIVPYGWRLHVLRQTFSYSVRFQIMSLFIMVSEPITKSFITLFGGLSATAYYEMASRMVGQLRALVVAGNRVIVPRIAAATVAESARAVDLYQMTYRVVFFLAVPAYCLLIVLTPLIGRLWIGRPEPDFIFFGVALSVGYMASTLAAPSYFFGLGTGDLKWNMRAHIFLGCAAVTFGYGLGYVFGGWGVAVGQALALIVSAAMMILGYMPANNWSLKDVIPNESRGLAVLSFVLACAGLAVVLVYDANGVSGGTVFVITSILMALIVLVYLRHPLSSVLLGKIQRTFKRSDAGEGVTRRKDAT